MSNQEIVDRLKKSYREHIFKYKEEERQGNYGNADAAWNTVLLLGGLLGKSTERMEKDMEEKRE